MIKLYVDIRIKEGWCMKKKLKISLLLIIGIIILGLKTYNLFNRYDVTRTIRYGILEDTLDYEGALIFNENVLKSSGLGAANYHYKTGDRVRKGKKVLDIGVSNMSGNQEKSAQYDVEALSIAQMIRNSEEIDTQKIKTMKNAIISSRYDDRKKSNEMSRVNVKASSNYAMQAGMFTSFTDQMEGYYTLENFQTMKLIPISEMIDRSESPIVQSGDVVGRIVDNYVYYIVFDIKKEDEKHFELKAKRELILDEGMIIKGIVANKSEFDDKVRILMSFKENAEYFLSRRWVDFKVIIDHEQGLLIPKTALSTHEEKIGVYVENIDQTYTFKPISIIKENEVNVVVKENYFKKDDKTFKTVKLYDDVLIDSENISHYKVR
jgi:hypothetical protein